MGNCEIEKSSTSQIVVDRKKYRVGGYRSTVDYRLSLFKL